MKVMKRLMALGIALVIMTAPVLATDVAWDVNEDPITWYFGDDADAIVSAESPSVGPVTEVTPTPVPSQEVVSFTVKSSGKKYVVINPGKAKLVGVKLKSKKVEVPLTAKSEGQVYDVDALGKTALDGAVNVKKIYINKRIQIGDFVARYGDTKKITVIFRNGVSKKDAKKMTKRLNAIGFEGKIKQEK